MDQAKVDDEDADGRNVDEHQQEKLEIPNLISFNDSIHSNNSFDKTLKTTEIEQLRYRISQLEHLIISPSSSNVHVHASLVPPPYYSTIINQHQEQDLSAISPNYETNSLLYRINQLESLLAGSEIESRSLQQEIQLLNSAKNRQQMELLEEIKAKNIQIQTYREQQELMEIKNVNNQKRLATIEGYINTLPSQEELNELQGMVDKLYTENDYLSNRVEKVKLELSKSQKELISKEHLLQSACLKLEELKPYEDAQESLLKETYSKSDPLASGDYTEKENPSTSLSYFSNEKNILNLVTLQKTQLNQSNKCIQALRLKLAKRETEKNELLMKIADKVKLFGELQEQFICLQIENESVVEKEKRSLQAKNNLEKECANLKRIIENLQHSQQTRKDEIIKLIHLVTQVELCSSELQQLIQLCQTICNGEEPSVEHLIGMNSTSHLRQGVEVEDDLAEGVEDYVENNGLNLEWILEKLVLVCKQRQQLQSLRTQINNLYTDTLAQDIEKCNVQ